MIIAARTTATRYAVVAHQALLHGVTCDVFHTNPATGVVVVHLFSDDVRKSIRVGLRGGVEFLKAAPRFEHDEPVRNYPIRQTEDEMTELRREAKNDPNFYAALAPEVEDE